jgi:hypothetical protein
MARVAEAIANGVGMKTNEAPPKTSDATATPLL